MVIAYTHKRRSQMATPFSTTKKLFDQTKLQSSSRLLHGSVAFAIKQPITAQTTQAEAKAHRMTANDRWRAKGPKSRIDIHLA